MPELLLEVGCEELPASFVRKACDDLAEGIARRLEAAGLTYRPGSGPWGTPRRLIVHFTELPDSQEPRTEEKRGPSEAAAFGPDGQPTPALVGFCKSMGADLADVRRGGGYVWLSKFIPGKAAIEVLAEALPDAIRSLTFEKAMRWGSTRMRFARPIRWILAAFDGTSIPFRIESVEAGLESRGHRFLAPGSFVARNLSELMEGLRERFVEPDPEARRQAIVTGARAVASGEPLLEPALVEENVYLTEWPRALEGEFKREFLELPSAVLITAMAKHERFFPVRSKDGKLTHRFVSIWNSGDEATVRAGNEWVLNARFNDAKFFYDEDKKRSLDEFLQATSGIVFQERLGSVRARADRLEKLAGRVAEATGAGTEEVQWAAFAGKYCKADLSSGLVSELPALQGVVGGEYARREGFPGPVCHAIASHYDLDNVPEIACAEARTAVRLLVADQLDKLVGYLGIGQAPSGSSDPVGLRRAASHLIEAAWRWPEPVALYDPNGLIGFAAELYRDQGVNLDAERVLASLQTLMQSRYEALLPEVSADRLEAVADWALWPRKLRLRLDILARLADDVAFVQTATRPLNILSAAIKKGAYDTPNDPSEADSELDRSLASDSGRALLAATHEALSRLADAEAEEDAERTVAALRSLESPINAFFETTMVMDEDERTRLARLRLVELVCGALAYGGDFSKLVIEG